MSQSGWLPIASAPRDGTKILCFEPTYGQIQVCIPKTLTAYDPKRFGERWEWFRDDEVAPGHTWSLRGVTHWMPLPDPPVAAEAGRQE